VQVTDVWNGCGNYNILVKMYPVQRTLLSCPAISVNEMFTDNQWRW